MDEKKLEWTPPPFVIFQKGRKEYRRFVGFAPNTGHAAKLIEGVIEQSRKTYGGLIDNDPVGRDDFEVFSATGWNRV